MRLQAFFDTIAPYLHGQAPHDETARALYPAGDAAALAARRLRIYGRFCRAHRLEAVTVFAYSKDAVAAARGEAAWEALVDAYFRAHPMRRFELNENGAGLPAFLQGYAAGAGLPAFLPELADFEWWEWQAQIAPDDTEGAPEDIDAGPLRLSSTVELRRYGHDLPGWIDEAERAGAPAEAETLVLFWRDRDLRPRRERAAPAELLVLQALSQGQPPPDALVETLRDLHEAGIVVGALL